MVNGLLHQRVRSPNPATCEIELVDASSSSSGIMHLQVTGVAITLLKTILCLPMPSGPQLAVATATKNLVANDAIPEMNTIQHGHGPSMRNN